MRSKTMTTVNFAIVATILTFALSPSASAQEPPVGREGKGIEGTWNHQLTPRNCATGEPLAQLSTISAYSQGGVVTELNPTLPLTLRSPGLGVWKHIRGREYTLAIKQFRFNPDGSYAGKNIIVSNITHLLDDSLEQVASASIYDAADNIIAVGCSTLISTRFTGEK